MKRSKKYGLLICVAATIVCGGLLWTNRAKLFNESYSTAASMQSDEKKADGRCFKSREGQDDPASYEIEILKEKQDRDREMFGYSTDIALSEAVRIVNEEMQCSPLFRSYPPLTEDEVIAAIVVGVNESHRGTTFLAERDALWKIATHRMMPKGSLLRASAGGNVQGSPLSPYRTINAQGIKIFLMLGLDKEGRDDFPPVLKLEEMLTIRKTFSGIKIK